MAVFEKVKSTRVLLDDSIPLLCSVDSGHIVGDHVEYELRIKRGVTAPSTSEWMATKRYNDFAILDALLRQNGVPAPLPPKKVFGNKDREFIADRKQKLQVFLSAILSHPLAANSLAVRRFLDGSTYDKDFQGIALQHISMFFRSELGWEVVEPLPEIGWRLRKCYFFVRRLQQPKEKFILSWTPLGPHSSISEKDGGTLMKLLPNFRHKYLYPVEMAFANDSGGLTIRRYCEHGTVRDILCKAKPKSPCMKKYVRPKAYQTFNKAQIQQFGRQILEALKFLHEKNFPYGHLHTGNIIIEDNCCKLLDIENFLLGLPSFYRPCIAEIKKIKTTEAADVYAFGCVLFEMAFGALLPTPSIDKVPDGCPADLRDVIESILLAEKQKAGVPSLEALLETDFFSRVTIPAFEKPQLKVPSKLKEVIRLSKEEQEGKLVQEQRAISQHHRQAKIKSHHFSEDEKKKRRKQKRLSQKQKSEDVEGLDSAEPVQSLGATEPAKGKPLANGTAKPAPPPAAPPAAPPAPPPPPPPSAPPASGGAALPPPQEGRGALLGSIANFSKTGLKKAVTVDKSGPRV